MRFLLVLALFTLQTLSAQANGLFGNNKSDDSFSVKSIQGHQAVLEGIPKDLKAGDSLYFNRSPFQFTVTSVKGNEVTVNLPDGHELKDGNALLRFATDPIKKNIATKKKLEQALE